MFSYDFLYFSRLSVFIRLCFMHNVVSWSEIDVIIYCRQQMLDTHPTPVPKDLVLGMAHLLVQGGARKEAGGLEGSFEKEALVVWQGLQKLPA